MCIAMVPLRVISTRSQIGGVLRKTGAHVIGSPDGCPSATCIPAAQQGIAMQQQLRFARQSLGNLLYRQERRFATGFWCEGGQMIARPRLASPLL
jgi:hypothetical protein